MKQIINLRIIYRVLIIVFTGIFLSVPVLAQDEEEEEKGKDKRPVRAPFASSVLIDNQTIVVPGKGTLQMDINHRFGTFANGGDFWGLWAPSNIRIAMVYSVIDDLSIGVGATKFRTMADVNLKWNFLKQTRSWSVPVSLTYYGVVGIDTRNKSNFAKGVYRLNYFNELIIGTRFSPKLSLQLAPSISHFNLVDSLYSNDIVALTFNGRYKISSQSSIIFEYDQQLTSHEATDPVTGNTLPRPNLAFGIEVSTSSHAFQLFLGNFQNILYQSNMVYNTNDFTRGFDYFLIGFNITRLWNF